ncbi:hypothetical protein [Bacteroides caecimuris]|uniref:hypothetical protein n=1 Tax=Bacteroides caecimuris TaxID=1796613 RepID=UPI00264A018F|nr:hypothetical protein [Bacteroides caecimuris]
MTECITGIYLTDVVDDKTIRVSIEDCPKRTLCRWIWKMDDKDIDSLIDSLVESIKKFRKIIGQPILGDDLILDASKKSTLARSTKDFLAESMCTTLRHWNNQYGIIEKNM